MQLNKVCEIEDFSSPELLDILRRSFGPLETHGPVWPDSQEDRKFWEVGMAILALERLVPRSQRLHALGIGTGTEATSFILTNHFRWVFATDLYGTGQWRDDAVGTMLTSPETFAGSIPCNLNHLVVQHMNATQLRFDDGCFDFIYSSSSIEHFGDRSAIKSAAQEMGRVLRPGGVMSISTELRLSGASDWLSPSTFLFTEESLRELIIEPSGCTVVDIPSYSASLPTLVQPTNYLNALKQLPHMRQRMQHRWSSYPHIVIEDGPLSWTSVQVTLIKA